MVKDARLAVRLKAKAFSLHHEFEQSPVDELTLMLLVQDIPGARG